MTAGENYKNNEFYLTFIIIIYFFCYNILVPIIATLLGQNKTS